MPKKETSLRTIILLFTILFFLPIDISSQNLVFNKGEKLRYNLYYQWGLFWKKAAEATLTTQETIFQSNKALHMRMSARTTPFFDNFLRVRDTLISYTSTQFQPLYYSKITHEGKYNGKEDLSYKYLNGKTSTRARTFRDNIQRDDTTFFHNGTPVYDMLSVFYFVRTLNISTMKINETIPLVIVSGNQPFNINVTYNGEVTMETPDNTKYQTYKVTLSFEHMKGKKREKEELQFWMSKDSQRLPMQFSAKLPLGSLKAYFQGIE